MSSRTQSKTKSNTTTATKSREIGKKETNRDELLRYMKNYRNRFHFGNVLGSGRSGNVFTTTLCGKTGALKMVDLYKNEDRLNELLNEIEIYIGPLKEIQEIYVSRLLNFGILHEAFVFILTSLAGESFAKIGNNVTREEKQLAVNGLRELHSKGVMHGDIRLENIMVKRKNELKGSSCLKKENYTN